jgi:DNA sulfur modification protein DndB
MEDQLYEFSAMRGIQAGFEYYLLTCPIKLIPKIFSFNEKEVPPELRSQRILNKSRIPELTNYILNNPTEYVFSAITASVDKDITFRPINELYQNIGIIKIPMSARIIINDGQHRRAAIQEALEENPDLGQDHIGVVLFYDKGLRRSQQMFADLNRFAVRPSKSLGILYDHREPLALLAKELVKKVDVFNGMTEMEKTSISNRSTKLFTLSGIYHATQSLLDIPSPRHPVTKDQTELAIEFWNEVSIYFPDWQMAKNKKVSPCDLRQDYLHSHAICLQVIGNIGATLIGEYPKDWKKRLKNFEKVNWSRSNVKDWEGRALLGGKVNKARQNVILTTNIVKNILGISLSEEESKIENSFEQRTG